MSEDGLPEPPQRTVLQGIEAVLAEAGTPMHYRDIATAMIDRGFWQTSGKTPWDTVNARLSVNINAFGAGSRFQRTARGLYALRAWGLSDFDGLPAGLDGDLNGSVTTEHEKPAPFEAQATDAGAAEALHLDGDAIEKPTLVTINPPPSGRKPLRFTDAAEQVLARLGHDGPMHYREITRKALELGLLTTEGKTPEATLYSVILTENEQAEKRGQAPRFVKHGRGMISLAHGAPSSIGKQIQQDSAHPSQDLLMHPGAPNGDLNDAPSAEHEVPKVVNLSGTGTGAVEGSLVSGSDTSDPAPVAPSPSPSGRKPLRFTDVAEQVLARLGHDRPMHYREITRLARELGLLTTEGKTPEATLYSVVLTEIERAEKRGQTPRFVKHGRGMISLAHGAQPGTASPARGAQASIVDQIKLHNMQLHQQLLAHLKEMSPQAFEELIGKVLGEIGFEEITNTTYSSDGGIDVRGQMVVGGVIRTTMAVQAKRWKNNVQAPIVQQVRGSLGTHEQGLIITTSDFSLGARKEAQRENAVPVALMNGEQLVDLLFEHGIGVQRATHDLFTLAAEWDPQRVETLPNQPFQLDSTL